MYRYISTFFLFLSLIVLTAKAQMQTMFVSQINGSQEVPSVSTQALGTAYFVLDPSRTNLSYHITVDGLSGPITGSHFHNAAKDTSGPVIFNITSSFVNGTATGNIQINALYLTQLLAGRMYVNVHTAAHPAGEIRGQIMPAADFLASLNGSQEVPPVNTTAGGEAGFLFNANAMTMIYDISIDSLSGPFTGAHIHNASAGINGQVVFNLLPSFTGNHASGTLPNLTAQQMMDFKSGDMYVNVHTTAHPGGEIRGQIQPTIYIVSALDGNQEVPAVNISAGGTSVFILFPLTKTLLYRVTVSGLSGAITGSHFHSALKGVNGSVVYNITASYIGNTATGMWNNLTDTQITAILSGAIYVNVHTAAHPAGEIRGQLTPPAPAQTFVRSSISKPDKIYLSQNYPNPLSSGRGSSRSIGNPTTRIEFSIVEKRLVSLEVFNLLGQRVASLIDKKEMETGIYSIPFNASTLESGTYIYRLTAGTTQLTRKMTILK